MLFLGFLIYGFLFMLFVGIRDVYFLVGMLSVVYSLKIVENSEII